MSMIGLLPYLIVAAIAGGIGGWILGHSGDWTVIARLSEELREAKIARDYWYDQWLTLVHEKYAGSSRPPPSKYGPGHWRSVLGVGDRKVSKKDVQTLYIKLAKKHHPDYGGDASRMKAINIARDQALKEVA